MVAAKNGWAERHETAEAAEVSASVCCLPACTIDVACWHQQGAVHAGSACLRRHHSFGARLQGEAANAVQVQGPGVAEAMQDLQQACQNGDAEAQVCRLLWCTAARHVLHTLGPQQVSAALQDAAAGDAHPPEAVVGTSRAAAEGQVIISCSPLHVQAQNHCLDP